MAGQDGEAKLPPPSTEEDGFLEEDPGEEDRVFKPADSAQFQDGVDR